MRRNVHDLLVARPHVRPRTRYTAEEYRPYCEGYTWALIKALEAMTFAEEQHAIMERYRRRQGQGRRRDRERERKRA